MTTGHTCVALALGIVSATVLAGQPFTITTYAGNGSSGFSGDNGPAPAAQLSFPGSVAVDSKGNAYIADGGNNRVRMVSNGNITTIAGNGSAGYSGDNASAVNAELNNPVGVALDSAGNLYIADGGNNVIRKVTPSGTITTFAGNNGLGAGYGGDGGVATGAQLNSPAAVAVDSSGNLYIADSKNNLIRKVSGGNMSSVVGILNTATKIKNPTGIAFDAAGNLYIADTGNRRIAKFSGGNLTTVAGNGLAGFSGDNGQATNASLNDPTGVAVDAAGNLYIADTFNNRIRTVSTGGIITTIAGKSGPAGYTGDGGLATQAGLYFPKGVTLDPAGNVYIADTSNNAIRLLQPLPPVITSNGVVNAASRAPQISPGALATVLGSNFGTASASANPPLATILGGVSVEINGQAAPIQYVAGNQINIQVPWETSLGTATVTVSVNSAVSAAASVPVAPAGPGLFVGSSGAAIIQNADLTTNSPSNPAAVGSTITAMLTGSGPVTPPVPDGAATPSDVAVVLTSQMSATIGGATAEVVSAVLAPGSVGIVQVGIIVPSSLATGDYPLAVGIGDETSNSGIVSVTQ